MPIIFSQYSLGDSFSTFLQIHLADSSAVLLNLLTKDVNFLSPIKDPERAHMKSVQL